MQCFELYEIFLLKCLVGGLVSSKTPGKSFTGKSYPPEPFYFTQPIQVFSNLTWKLLCVCKDAQTFKKASKMKQFLTQL